LCSLARPAAYLEKTFLPARKHFMPAKCLSPASVTFVPQMSSDRKFVSPASSFRPASVTFVLLRGQRRWHRWPTKQRARRTLRGVMLDSIVPALLAKT
jgi:hypothetical protein